MRTYQIRGRIARETDLKLQREHDLMRELQREHDLKLQREHDLMMRESHARLI
jgi:hypothetical protein